jgi:hypothetical protein
LIYRKPIEDNISPAQFENWLTRQGWERMDKEVNGKRPYWTMPDPNKSEPWVVVCDRSFPNRLNRNRDTIEALADIYCCHEWEIIAVLKVEGNGLSNGLPDPLGTIEIYDQTERLVFAGGEYVELSDHNPAVIKLDKDGGDLLIALIISQRHGWASSAEAFGRGGGSFTLTIGSA